MAYITPYATGTYTTSTTASWTITTTGSSTATIAVSSPRRLPIRIHRGEECDITLPDGSVLHVEKSGNWRIDDTNAQTLYRGNAELDFNRYLNASDILEDFIGFVGGLGVRREELLALPVSAFIQFLIVQAAMEDGEDADMGEVAALVIGPKGLPASPQRKRCGCCGRFIKSGSQQSYCTADHAAQAARKAFERNLSCLS